MIVGLLGPSGAGKDFAASILVEHRGFVHWSLSDDLRTLAKNELGDDLTRAQQSEFADALRKRYSSTCLVDRALSLCGISDVVLSGLYATEECARVSSVGGITIGIVAPDFLRFSRVKSRAQARDTLSYEAFVEQSKRELDPTVYVGRMNVQEADYIIENDSNDPARFKEKIVNLVDSAR